MSFKEGKWVKRQKISDFNGIIDEWYSFVCFSCFEKINSLIVRDLVFCPVVFSED
ncbi:MAG: hypothetical protein NC926_10670 [Candidatus Omnitrophica bacterium]|nr:hypothetical protein [Candidatus Omnitrophota bacterium]